MPFEFDIKYLLSDTYNRHPGSSRIDSSRVSQGLTNINRAHLTTMVSTPVCGHKGNGKLSTIGWWNTEFNSLFKCLFYKHNHTNDQLTFLVPSQAPHPSLMSTSSSLQQHSTAALQLLCCQLVQHLGAVHTQTMLMKHWAIACHHSTLCAEHWPWWPVCWQYSAEAPVIYWWLCYSSPSSFCSESAL